MAANLSRRSLFLGGLFALAAPAIVRASNIMSVRDPHLVRGILIDKTGWVYPLKFNVPDRGDGRADWRSFEPLAEGRESLLHDTVYLHESDWRVVEFRKIEKFSAALEEQANKIPLEVRAGRQRKALFASDLKVNKHRYSTVDLHSAVKKDLERPDRWLKFQMSRVDSASVPVHPNYPYFPLDEA